MTIVIALAFGAVIGSLLNVVAIRLPRGQSLVRPGSHCPGCRAPIRWFDNIPILSFLILRGRCRRCQARISWRYPLVEAATAVLFALAAWRFGLRPEALVPAWIFLAALVAIAAIDLEHQIIPDRISLPGIAAGFLASFVSPSLAWTGSLLGIAVGGGLVLLIIVIGGWLSGRDAMGVGDLKLTAMIGAFLGWPLTVSTLFMAVVLGGVVGAVLLVTGLRGRKDPIPFGPFLAASAVASLLWGDALLDWYWSGFAS